MEGTAAGDTVHRSPAPRTYRRALAVGLSLSALIHAALLGFVALPGSGLPWDGGDEWELLEVEIPPRVEIPPAPETYPRPSPPEIVAVKLAEFEGPAAGPVRRGGVAPLPEPARVTTARPEERPALAPPEVAPTLEAPEHFRRRLERSYPRLLRDRGVGGVVRLQFFVDPRGDVSRVEVAESSGHETLDRVARRMAGEMRFLPALNRDRAVGVWVSQKICFVTVAARGEEPGFAECEHRVALGGR